jgi:hypothetical protein
MAVYPMAATPRTPSLTDLTNNPWDIAPPFSPPAKPMPTSYVAANPDQATNGILTKSF